MRHAAADSSPLVFLTGFDRSGTSVISRTLASTPGVELLMQPFNGSSFREDIYTILTESNARQEQVLLLEGMAKGQIMTELIRSPWFFRNSTTTEWIPHATHIVKSTISHLHYPWIAERSNASFWCVWRSPLEVLNSIFANGFEGWYKDSADAIQNVVAASPELSDAFPPSSFSQLSTVGEVAMNFAVRMYHLLSVLPERNVINYSQFCDCPADALNPFLSSVGRRPCTITSQIEADLNILGTRLTTKPDRIAGYLPEVERIVEPVLAILNSRHKAQLSDP